MNLPEGSKTNRSVSSTWIRIPSPKIGSPDIKVGLSPCRSDQESCDLGRKRLIHGFFWDLSLSSVSLPLSTAAEQAPLWLGGLLGGCQEST